MDDDHHNVTPGDGTEWIGLGDAARRLGVTRAAIYGRIERGTLTSRPRGNRGLEVLWPSPQYHPDRQGKDNPNGNHDGQGDVAVTVTGNVMATMVEDLRERLERSEGEVQQLRGQVADLRVEVAKAHAQVDAARAVAIADVAAARAGTEAQAKLVTQLEALLADVRRPWWRRLIG
jgi:hypothetical protein